MLNLNKSINLNGSITVDVTDATTGEKTTQQVAYVSAAINANGSGPNINVNITNQTLYEANKEAVQADITSFNTKVFTEIDNTTTGGTK